jgi:Phage derived protein Gp49-like (DUF891)
MKRVEEWNWAFRGYQTAVDGQPVQDWFDDLPEDAQDEARAAIGYLQHLPIRLWGPPTFKHLGNSLSEIRFRLLTVRYRIYGYFGPKGYVRTYTFLHGTDKKVSNDRDGKELASDRLGKIERNRASTHAFMFEARTP